ncbi:MAG: molybdenum cofactor guanylyltransferase MobA [Arcobacteraceae bacterium]
MKRNNPSLSFHDFPIVILCGGKSSRMGEDKTLLPFGEYDSLIHFQFERLSVSFSNVYVSSKKHTFDFLDKNSSVILYDNEQTVHSPLIALQSILKQLDAPKVCILTVDTPFVRINTLKLLIEKSDDYEITIASTLERTHHLCGVFSQSLLEKIEHMLEQDIHKIGYLIKQSHSQILKFENEEEFLNLNTKDEYSKALQQLKTYQNCL